MTYRIKPLVWVQSRRIDWMWQVTAWVPYDIRCEGGIGYLVDYESETIAGPYDSLNEAKAAAQADYEARILSALEPTPTPLPEVVMREHAAVAADSHARYSEAAILATPALVALDHIHDITSSRLARKIGESIRALPTTATHAELLDAAAQLPEVKMLVEALRMASIWLNYDGRYDMQGINSALAPFTRKGE